MIDLLILCSVLLASSNPEAPAVIVQLLFISLSLITILINSNPASHVPPTPIVLLHPPLVTPPVIAFLATEIRELVVSMLGLHQQPPQHL